MARGEILRKLFKSCSHNEREQFLLAAQELIDEERNKITFSSQETLKSSCITATSNPLPLTAHPGNNLQNPRKTKRQAYPCFQSNDLT